MPDQEKRKSNVEVEVNVANSRLQRNMVKSPSDTTIYVPTLCRMNTPDKIATNIGHKIARTPPDIIEEANNLTIQDKITDFVESVRRQQTQTGNQVVNQGAGTSQGQVQSVVNVSGQEEARNKTANAILEAEKFRTVVVKLAGTDMLIDNGGQGQVVDGNVLPIFQHIDHNLLDKDPQVNLAPYMSVGCGPGVTDDDFFHLTSHIDNNLQEKVKKRQYVDLDKLLPKDHFSCFDGRGTSVNDDNKFEWVQRDGGTFLMPARKTSRITGFRKWEQVFWVYATIYCSKNPTRSTEI